MNKRILGQLRSRASAILGRRETPEPAAAAAKPTPAQAPADALQGLGVAERAPQGQGPSFRAMFAAEPHRSSLPQEQLDAQIRELALRIEQLQPGYQPVYGFTDAFPGKRVKHLDRNVALVHEHLKDVRSKHQVRIVDVGCNSGYVTLRLAEAFPSVVGLEIAQHNLQLCRLLAARAGSPAKFFSDNVLDMLESGDNDFENVDLVLLFNIVHQFIFAHGLERTQALLARLAGSVDTIIVELARREDYVRHGKDHLLPEDPAEALAGCTGIEITRLEDRPRPIYKLRRKTVRIGTVAIQPEKIDYSLNPDARVSRKYYSGGGRFLKLYRFNAEGERDMFEREVAALSKLQNNDRVPKFFGSAATAHVGAVLMSHVAGDRLVPRLYNADRNKITPAERLQLTRQYLEIASIVHESVGYQNDLQAHNLLVQPGGSLVLVDFEQAGSEPINDPFGLLLWTVFDFWGGRDKNRPAAIRSLRLAPEGAVDPAMQRIYPDFTGVVMAPVVADLVTQAMKGGDWGPFVAEWAQRLGAQPQDAAAPR